MLEKAVIHIAVVFVPFLRFMARIPSLGLEETNYVVMTSGNEVKSSDVYLVSRMKHQVLLLKN